MTLCVFCDLGLEPKEFVVTHRHARTKFWRHVIDSKKMNCPANPSLKLKVKTSKVRKRAKKSRV